MQDGALQAVLVTAEATEVRSVTLHIRWQVRTPMCGAILGRSDAHVRCHIRQVRTPMCGACAAGSTLGFSFLEPLLIRDTRYSIRDT